MSGSAGQNMLRKQRYGLNSTFLRTEEFCKRKPHGSSILAG